MAEPNITRRCPGNPRRRRERIGLAGNANVTVAAPWAMGALLPSPCLYPRPPPVSPSVQLDFFPERVRIDQLDPREVAGARTRVEAVFVVRFEWEKAVHQVIRDHYGLYCAEHGRGCRAVAAVSVQSRA